MNRPIVFGTIRGTQVHDPRLTAPSDRTLSNVVKLGKADQWREVADARESQERRFGCEEPDHDLERYLWRYNRGQRIEDSEPQKGGPSWLAAVCIAWLITIGVFYVLTCGLTPWGGCWK